MRILLADDHPEVRSGLRLLLEHEPGVSWIGEAEGIEELLHLAGAVNPDLVLLDWDLTAERPDELIDQLHSLEPRASLVALSGRPEARKEAMAAGADAFVSKGDEPERLLAVVREAGKHKY